MPDPSREFQVFVKPAGAKCNLNCRYCYYLEKAEPFDGKSAKMSADLLEKYIVQHIEASTEPLINFSWHGGEPLLAGIDFYRKAVEIQKRYCPAGRTILNGIQTNGTLINEEWCRFFRKENFIAGISMDGPEKLHDLFRVSKNHEPTFRKVIRGYDLLVKHHVPTEILCVVNAENVKYPEEMYDFFRQSGASFITFLPLVERIADDDPAVSQISVPAVGFGEFLCSVFDAWVENDIGRIKVQVFEEAVRTAFGQDHTLCIFKKTCGGVPVVEHNGDFYSCDHYVNSNHLLGNIKDTQLVSLLESPLQKAFGQAKLDTLPQYCLECNVLDMCNGECPKNRFILTPDGKPGLNYLCEGYKLFFNHCRPFVNAVTSAWKS